MFEQAQWQMNIDRHNTLLKVAANQRLLTNAYPKAPRRTGRLLTNVADFLIAFGLRLKARYEPAI
jgi:hypothetical protein